MKKKIIFTILVIGLGFALNSLYYKTLSPAVSDDLALSTVNEQDSTDRMVLRQSYDVNNYMDVTFFVVTLGILVCIWRKELKSMYASF